MNYNLEGIFKFTLGLNRFYQSSAVECGIKAVTVSCVPSAYVPRRGVSSMATITGSIPHPMAELWSNCRVRPKLPRSRTWWLPPGSRRRYAALRKRCSTLPPTAPAGCCCPPARCCCWNAGAHQPPPMTLGLACVSSQLGLKQLNQTV
jgi:hypothetical protein